MRAFLSHSSKDQAFVHAVANELRAGSYELDTETFERGIFNSEAILNALNGCSIFCLFWSNHTPLSRYVDFETKIAIELVAAGKIKSILCFCMDDESFDTINTNVKYYNVVRRTSSVDHTARLIQGALLQQKIADNQSFHPFIGREKEMDELERITTSLDGPRIKAIYVSGHAGSGRKTLIKQFFARQFPRIGRIFPTVNIDAYSGLSEIYRSLVWAINPSTTKHDMIKKIQYFDISGEDERYSIISGLLKSVQQDRECLIIEDAGGLLNDDASFSSEFNRIIDDASDTPHPSISFVARRRAQSYQRRQARDVAYVGIDSLSSESIRRLISRLLISSDLTATDEQLDDLVDLSDGTPLNVYRMVECISDSNVKIFLSDPSSFIEWKHKQSSEYVSKIEFNELDIHILYLLKVVPELDFDNLCKSTKAESESVSERLIRLAGYHLIEISNDVIRLSAAVSIAVQRDRRIRLSSNQHKHSLQVISTNLIIRIDDGSAPIRLIDSAILASVESADTLSATVSMFLLPSHFVTIAQRRYDSGNYKESLKLARRALEGGQRLSPAGQMAAGRLLCLSASRLGEAASFDEGLRLLKSGRQDKYARANISFLLGFNERMNGHLPAADRHFRTAVRLHPNNTSAHRELASVCLQRGHLEDAEIFARKSNENAPHNPYFVDVLLSVLIRRYGKSPTHEEEISRLFGVLRSVGEDDEMSFYTCRRAEFEHLYGNNDDALTLINEAIRKTKHLFEAHRLRALIMIKADRASMAKDDMDFLRKAVFDGKRPERKAMLRSYRETEIKYLTAIGKYYDAKQIYNNTSIFDRSEAEAGVKEIEGVEQFGSRPPRR